MAVCIRKKAQYVHESTVAIMYWVMRALHTDAAPPQARVNRGHQERIAVAIEAGYGYASCSTWVA